ncbi:MAG TPA: O-methyltransferase [Spirochaetia bacterium]|nr:O-methyltransferase [Spirochaetia bacterium]
MSGIVDAKVEKYISSLDGKQDSVRRQMEEIARGNGFPIVGPQVGRLLSILARSVNARRILELGSGYGYSALWFARGMQEGGSIDCTDLSTENRDLALRFFREAGIEKFVTFHVGDALEVARAQTGPFDVVFNDIDKPDYPRSIPVALQLLRVGGLFITDNVLWSGKVADQRKADQDTAAIRQFNQMVCSRDDLETVILPLRDGVAVCQKVR